MKTCKKCGSCYEPVTTETICGDCVAKALIDNCSFPSLGGAVVPEPPADVGPVLTQKEAIALLGQLSLVEYAIEAAACGDDGGPLTSSPTQRRNVANTLRGLASKFEDLADAVDPLMVAPEQVVPIQKTEPADGEDTTSTPPAGA